MGAKQLIILLISLLIVPACSVNEKEIPVPVNPEQGKVPVSISITLDAALVPRSDWQYDGYFPSITEEERKVKNVFLVIFKDILLEDFAYLEDVRQEDDFSILLEGENEEDEENVFDLEPGPHYFYALLNVSPELKELLEAKIEGRENELTKSEFEKEILNKSLSDLTGEGEQFLMTNTSPPEVQAIYSDYQIEENPTLHNNIEITVGRAVGKISFAYVADQVQTGELHGGLSNIRYKILNNPAQMYLMPVIEEDILKTPHYDGGYPAGYFSPSATDADILENTTTSVWLEANTTAIVEAGDEKSSGYFVENNNSSTLRSNSTMLLIEAKFTPAVWLNPDSTKGAPNENGTFYRIGQYNSSGSLLAYFQGYYNEYPQEILNKLQATNGYYKVATYENGITYYGIWPRNKELLHSHKRNSYYKVAITHIHGAGEPLPKDVVDPDVDPDDVDTWGDLRIYFVTWDDENRVIIIGDETEDDSLNGTFTPKPWDEDEQENTLDGNNAWD